MSPSSFLCIAVVAVSLASAGYAKPLSTYADGMPRERSPVAVAPLFVENHPYGTLNDSYIIMLKDGIAPSLMQNHLNFVANVHEASAGYNDALDGLTHVYDGHIKGYAGKFAASTIDRIREMPEVDFVERDQIVKTLDIDVPLLKNPGLETQKGAPWGLARISHRPKLTFGTFTKYVYDKNGGQGVDVYVIDTGVFVNHTQFEGRAIWGETVPKNDVDEDNHGHGTHCAGTIASKNYGVAKAANIIAVKVLGSNGSGTMSDVVQGVTWAALRAKSRWDAAKAEYAATGKTSHKGSVANMSLGGGKSPTLDRAVNAAVDQGMHFAVAAGNDNRDACDNSPAAAEKAITVGASTLGDERAYFSNHGPCVDVFAPGLNILSTFIGSPDATTTMSGTSMASPHTAGILAYLLSLYPSATFDPLVAPDLVPSASLSPAFTTVYRLARSSLPSWVQSFMPMPEFLDEVAPVPGGPKTLTPKQLKLALLHLSTKDALATLPKDTVNLLIFNNATA